MGELFRMWRNTRMVVLTAICAALYAAILIPFKVVPLIPGITEFRPANAVPVVCSFLFGPAAAWGAAFGNLIGDFFGGLGPGDVFGFAGNFCFGLVPYLVWDAVTAAPPVRTAQAAGFRGVGSDAVRLFVPTLLGAMLCATVVGWGLQVLGFHPFNLLATIVLLNNLVVAAILSPLLLAVLYPRVARARLLYRDVLGPRPRLPRWRATLGVSLVVIGIVGGFGVGQLAASGQWLPPWVDAGATARAQVGYAVPPLFLVTMLGLALL
jgi:energy-coupling factor transport system substrate-specific component